MGRVEELLVVCRFKILRRKDQFEVATVLILVIVALSEF